MPPPSLLPHTQLLIPEETPLAIDVDFEWLARHEMSGGNVKSAVFRAASRAALRPDEDRKLAMKVFLQKHTVCTFSQKLKNVLTTLLWHENC